MNGQGGRDECFGGPDRDFASCERVKSGDRP